MNLESSALFNAIENTVASLPYIAPSQNFWLNRTNDGANYDLFYKEGIVGLELNELTLSEIANIRENNQLRNGKLRYENVKTQIQRAVFEKRKTIIASKPKGAKRSAELATTTRIANQIYNFVFDMKIGDYVVIPSKESRRITIGRIESNYLENSKYIHLVKKVKWEKTLFKATLDPYFYKLFFTQHSFAKISKYKDIVLRSLYDFYVDDENAHLVLNIQATNNIGAVNEAAFTYHFLQLIDGYIKEYNLPYDVSQLNTTVNLNSPGKRKFFGPIAITFLAGMAMLSIVGGGIERKNGNFNMKTGGIINSWASYLNHEKRREIADELLKRSDSLSMEKQQLLLDVIKELE